MFRRKPKEEVEPTPAHYLEVTMVKVSDWTFSFDTEKEALDTRDRIEAAMRSDATTITVQTVTLRVDLIAAVKYRDYHRTYYL